MRFPGFGMDTKNQERRRWRIFGWCAGGLFCLGMVVQAALVDLDAMVTYSIYDHLGNPLPDGAVVYIIGSGDGTMDPMSTYGSPTNLVAHSTTGDDVVLGQITIDSSQTGSNGTFFTTLQYESTQVGYVYIRFFEFTNSVPVTGLVYWGTSAIHQLSPTPTLGVNSVDFNPNATLVASNLNNFVAVPEPSTANLLILVAGMAWAMRASMKGKARSQPGQGDAQS